MREPFWLSIDQIGKLTDWQIAELYFRKLHTDEDDEPAAIPEPQTEEDVRAWCASVAASFNIPPEKFDAWADKAIAAWKRDKEEEARNASDSGEPSP